MKIDRLFGILTVLLRQGSATMPQLARRFEVSTRTISRDIDALCRAGIPLVTTQGWGGGVFIAEGYRLDPSLLTLPELDLLLAGVEGVGTVTHPAQLAALLEKLSSPAAPPPPMSIDLASHYRGPLSQKAALICQAIRQNRLVTFLYCSEKGESRRTAEPVRLFYRWDAWYLWAFCRTRQAPRLFKLNRLWELRLSPDTFTPRPLPEPPAPERYFERPAIHLKALFAPSEKYRLVEEYGPGSWSDAPGGLLLERDFVSFQNLLRWVQSFGDRVEVLEPAGLRRELRRQAEAVLSKYRET